MKHPKRKKDLTFWEKYIEYLGIGEGDIELGAYLFSRSVELGSPIETDFFRQPFLKDFELEISPRGFLELDTSLGELGPTSV